MCNVRARNTQTQRQKNNNNNNNKRKTQGKTEDGKNDGTQPKQVNLPSNQPKARPMFERTSNYVGARAQFYQIGWSIGWLVCLLLGRQSRDQLRSPSHAHTDQNNRNHHKHNKKQRTPRPARSSIEHPSHRPALTKTVPKIATLYNVQQLLSLYILI